MKWFFCWCQDTDFRADHNWKDLIRSSVESALRNTSLEPYFVYDGLPSSFTDELSEKGVKIIFHRLSFTREIIAHDPANTNYQAVARGAFLRFDIPILADITDEFVLYTDADVIFMNDDPMHGYKPDFLAAAPQFDRGNKADLNSGIMILNVKALREIRDQLINFTVQNLHLGLDQEILRVFLGKNYLLLPDIFNWKPYWGINPDASIVHWHGPKPETVAKILDSTETDINETWRNLFERNPEAYRHYVDQHRFYSTPQRTETLNISYAKLARCTSLIGTQKAYPGNPEITEVRDVFCVPPSASHPRDWGIFDENQRLVPETGFYRGSKNGCILPMQETFTTINLKDVKNEAPDDVYIYGGKLHPHYGHFLLSTLSRFWMFGTDQKPKMKILMHEETDPDHWFSVPHINFCFEHLGIEKTDFVKFGTPVRIKKLIIPNPSFIEEYSGYEAFSNLCNGIARNALSKTEIFDDNRPVYISKSKLDRGVWRFINEIEIEEELDRHGVEIVYPETLPLLDQIKLFNQKRTIASTMSSALHTSIFSWNGPDLIGIGHSSSVVSNYTISDEINGGSGRYLYPENGVEYLNADAAFTLNCRLINPRKIAEDVLNLIDKPKKRASGLSKFLFGIRPNIAIGKKASQSSICQWSSSQILEEDASGAVNGIKDGHQGFHTDIEDEPWWMIDLEDVYNIYTVKIFNRLDIQGVAERSNKIAIDIGIHECSLVEIYRRESDEIFGGIDGDPLIFDQSTPIRGRFVRVRLLHRSYLHLDQVEIYGDRLTSPVSSDKNGKMNDWLPIDLLKDGSVENEIIEVKRRFTSGIIAVFWIDGRWVYPPHWNETPGEEATHFRFVQNN